MWLLRLHPSYLSDLYHVVFCFYIIFYFLFFRLCFLLHIVIRPTSWDIPWLTTTKGSSCVHAISPLFASLASGINLSRIGSVAVADGPSGVSVVCSDTVVTICELTFFLYFFCWILSSVCVYVCVSASVSILFLPSIVLVLCPPSGPVGWNWTLFDDADIYFFATPITKMQTSAADRKEVTFVQPGIRSRSNGILALLDSLPLADGSLQRVSLALWAWRCETNLASGTRTYFFCTAYWNTVIQAHILVVVESALRYGRYSSV